MITVKYVLWGAPLPVGTQATLVTVGRDDTLPALAWVAVAHAAHPVLSLVPQGIVVHLQVAPRDQAAAVDAALEHCARDLGLDDRATLWTALTRLHRDRTWVDVGAAVASNSDYRHVLHTELLGSCAGAGTQYVAMTLRAKDAAGDPDGAVVPREVHREHAQFLVALGGRARGSVELVELERTVPLLATAMVRVPPGITHLVRLDKEDAADAELHVLSIYTAAEHPWDRVQATRPTL